MAESGAVLGARLGTLLRSKRVWRFGLVGLSGVFVNLGTLHLLADVLGLHRLVALPLAVETSILSNFALNNAWTFQDRNAEASAGCVERMLRYNLVALVGLIIQLVVFEASCQLIMLIRGTNDPESLMYLAAILGIAVATGWNFISNLRWTWAPASHQARSETGRARALGSTSSSRSPEKTPSRATDV